MTAFTKPVEIGNRAAQFCGANRMDLVLGFSDTSSRTAAEVSYVYDKLREAELERNDWTWAIRRTALRAINSKTMLLVPALWDSTLTYFVGSIVSDQSENFWISNIPSNFNNDPLLTTFWSPYSGPMAIPRYDNTNKTSYGAGEVVYTMPGDGQVYLTLISGEWTVTATVDGAYRVYLSLLDGNSDNPGIPTLWDASETYFQNQVVVFNNIAYMSLVDLNLNNQPDITPSKWTTSFAGGSGSDQWLEIGGPESSGGVSLTKLSIVYPLGSGPSSQQGSRNAFKLPAGFLRIAQQNPKGTATALGGPSGYTYNDWNIENGYLVSGDTGPIILRFVADLTDVRLMHAMFCEGLAARIAIAVCSSLTQSDSKLQSIASQYKKFMDEARIINAIETGYDDPPDDDYITVRL